MKRREVWWASLPEPSIPFAEHFVKYGFAVLPGLVNRAFCAEALAEIRRLVEDDRPLEEWTLDKPGVTNMAFFEDVGRDEGRSNAILGQIFDQPGLRAAVDELHGGPGRWDGVRNYYAFIKPYDPAGEPKLNLDMFHVDFGESSPPTLYRGFLFMVSLVDTEPFSGNFTCRPGSHIPAQKMFVENPELSGNDPEVKDSICDGLPVYEFVAEPGDVLLWHHLLYHEGNPSHSQNRKPRVALLGETFREEWLTEINADDPDLSPWERSLARNGSFKPSGEWESFARSKRAKRVAACEAKGIVVDEKWKHYSHRAG